MNGFRTSTSISLIKTQDSTGSLFLGDSIKPYSCREIELDPSVIEITFMTPVTMELMHRLANVVDFFVVELCNNFRDIKEIIHFNSVVPLRKDDTVLHLGADKNVSSMNFIDEIKYKAMTGR